MAREQGLAQGLKKGEAVGLKKGEAQKQREIAKAMKESGAEKEYIAKVTGLTWEEVEML